MKILVLAGDTPATTTMPGSPRLFSLCRGLAARHELHLATRCGTSERHETFLADPEVPRVFARVHVLPSPDRERLTWWNKQRHRLHIGAYIETRYLYPGHHREMVATIRGLVRTEAVDLVYVDGLAMTQYIEPDMEVPAVVDLHDSTTMLLSRMLRIEPTRRRKLLLSIDRMAIAKLERSLARSFALVITNSEVDEAAVRKVSPDARTFTIGNGVDSEYFAPVATARCPERLLFTGVMNYAPNEDAAVYFCNEIFPAVRARHPTAEFWVVGKDPTPTVRALGRQPGVHVIGGVPDMRPYLAEAGLFVCPLRYGAGIKNKILAALSMRMPVIATPVSVDGLELADGREVAIGRDALDFGAKIIELVEDRRRAQALADAGHQHVTRRYSWDASVRSLDGALEGVRASADRSPQRSARAVTPPLRVTYLIPGLHYGGMERLLHDLTKALPPRGFEVHVVIVGGFFGRFAEGLGDVATLHQVSAMSRWSLIYPGQLVDVLRRIAPDVVHSHAGVWFKASRAARLAGVPVVIHTEHGRRVPDLVSDRWIDNVASRSTDVVIAVSEALAEVLRSRVVHDPRRVRVIANGVDVDRLRPAPDVQALRQDLDIPVGTPVIGSVGRLEPVKNYQLALRALARLRNGDAGPAPVLLLVGDGSERGMLEDLARELGVTGHVRFLGWRDEVERLYGAFDLFTLSSHSEGMSISLLEAMSTGVCPVVTDVGGNRGVLGAELASSLVCANDAVALAAAWRHHLVDAQLRREIGRRARARVQARFSLERMVDDHIEIYRELTTAAGRGKRR
jgi:glycosyltransferase involved in cell wall biosynthesis